VLSEQVECIPEVPSLQGWFEPPDVFIPDNHMQYFQYDIFFEEPYFIQFMNNIYWVGTAPIQSPEFFWGWKTSMSEPFNDDAVYSLPGGRMDDSWFELRDPISDESLDLSFVITGDSPDYAPTACYTWVENIRWFKPTL